MVGLRSEICQRPDHLGSPLSVWLAALGGIVEPRFSESNCAGRDDQQQSGVFSSVSLEERGLPWDCAGTAKASRVCMGTGRLSLGSVAAATLPQMFIRGPRCAEKEGPWQDESRINLSAELTVRFRE